MTLNNQDEIPSGQQQILAVIEQIYIRSVYVYYKVNCLQVKVESEVVNLVPSSIEILQLKYGSDCDYDVGTVILVSFVQNVKQSTDNAHVKSVNEAHAMDQVLLNDAVLAVSEFNEKDDAHAIRIGEKDLKLSVQSKTALDVLRSQVKRCDISSVRDAKRLERDSIVSLAGLVIHQKQLNGAEYQFVVKDCLSSDTVQVQSSPQYVHESVKELVSLSQNGQLVVVFHNFCVRKNKLICTPLSRVKLVQEHCADYNGLMKMLKDNAQIDQEVDSNALDIPDQLTSLYDASQRDVNDVLICCQLMRLFSLELYVYSKDSQGSARSNSNSLVNTYGAAKFLIDDGTMQAVLIVENGRDLSLLLEVQMLQKINSELKTRQYCQLDNEDLTEYRTVLLHVKQVSNSWFGNPFRKTIDKVSTLCYQNVQFQLLSAITNKSKIMETLLKDTL
ncbi:hypothetical protein MP228_007391 [Amoeboaphelidium protococcarum]|nr:hypothetical protein MP228_007391 [Amoeboaphelidium protococcarum]